MPTLLTKPLITVDGDLSDWVDSERIDNPGNAVPGYALYGTVQNDTFFIAIKATSATDPIIGAGTTFWLNTDQNAATGYSPFDSIGADYNVTFVNGAFYLYTGAAGQNLVSATPLSSALSPDGESLEIAIPRSLLTPAGGPAPTNINIAAQIDTGTSSQLFLPSDYNNPEYTITDPATLLSKTPTHKVAIVYSDTSANHYFSQTAYSDLFMAAQNQARMAGVSYDIIDESQLTNINSLIGYDALIFPAMPDVDTTQLPAILATLTSAVYNYHIGIIAAGDFLTNDQTGAPLPGNSYANMETLLGLARYTGGNSGTETVTAADVSNPIMKGYSAGQVIQTYTNEGYAAYQGVAGTATDVLVNQNITGVGVLPGVVQTTTGGTNVHFASTNLLGDSNLLSNAIQGVTLGTPSGVTLHMSRDAGVLAVRMDMDQSQFPADVSPVDANGQPLPGIYDTLIPILQQWKQQYNFVGSYYVNIGDNPTAADPSMTVWAKNLPYYQAIQALGSEIGTHSYTHLINPPTTTVTETTVGDTPAGSTQITLSALPSFAGVTVGMIVTGAGLGTNTPLPSAAGEGGAIANTQVTAVSGKTITISYVPGGFGGVNDGAVADIPAGSTLTFSIPAENTNFLQTGTVGTVTGSDGDPFTYDYEFNQSKSLLQQQLGTIIYGAAIPGANETFATDQNILPYFQSVAPTATTPGYTGYLTGGWTGIGSGYPSAIGYMSPASTDTSSLYIAPNMTFDFTEIQYEGKTVAQTEADWAAQFNALKTNAVGTPIVVLPVHDYGVAAWNTTTDSPTGSPYTTQMYTDFIAQAYADNYEFLTLEELAARTEAQQKASIDYTTVGNTITATVTPDPTSPDVGEMALSVINGGTNVIQNVTNWYAYNSTELLLPTHGGSFTINLGATQDDVTHITSLPMRADLLSVTGDGLNLSFSMIGDGDVLIDLGNYGSLVPVVTGATIASIANGLLDLSLTGSGVDNVTLNWSAPPPGESVSAVLFSADTGASATDFVTQTAAQTITGTLSAPLAAGDVVRISLDDGVTWATATAATGGTTFSLSGVTLTGSGTLIAETQNSLGTASSPFTRAYILDQVPPAETPAIVAMTNDSGLAGDFITNNGAAGRTVSGTLSAALAGGETLSVSSDGGATWTNPTITGTAWSAIDSASHAANWTIEARVVDLAGNLGSLVSKTVTFDNTSPAAPSAPDLAAASDSGASNTDNITNVAAPTFTGTGAEAGGTVTLLDGTTSIGTAAAAADGSWSVTASPLVDGVHTITATVTDVAGNVGATSAALSVTIDTTAPAAPSAPDLIAASDSGKSTTDNITNVVTPTFQGTATALSTVILYDGTTALGSVAATSAGAWTFVVASPMQDGVHSITARTTDVAGNLGATSAALLVTIDTVATVPSTPDMLASSDKGISNTDNITNVPTPAFTGTAEAGSAVTLFDGATVIGTANASAAGVWNIAASTLTDGNHSISATAKDPAGNLSTASPALTVTIDTGIPAAPTAPDLLAASDSGVSNTDNITKNTTPTFTGMAEPGTTVTLFNGTTKVGTGLAAADGAWTITASALGNGTRIISAKATDVAGNVSAASPVLTVTIDTTINTPARPTLSAASDSGVSNADRITNVTTPAFTGTAEAGSTVTLFDGTAAIGSGTATAGIWSIVAAPLADGVHNIAAQAVDVAGNTSALSTALPVTIDTQAPSAPTFTAGNATTLVGKGEPGATVTISNATSTLGTAGVGSGGNWSMSFISSATPRSFAATQTDKAGNTSVASNGMVLIGTSASDALAGGQGNDLLIGAAAADTFSFSGNFGQDIVGDFAAGGAAHDIINFHGIAGLANFTNVLSHTAAAGSGVMISLDANNTVTLNNISKANLTSADFSFA